MPGSGFETDIRVEAANLSIHVQLVPAGHANAFLPGLLWRTHRMPSSLTIFADEPSSTSIALRVGSDTHPAIKAVSTAIQGSAAALATAGPSPRNPPGAQSPPYRRTSLVLGDRCLSPVEIDNCADHDLVSRLPTMLLPFKLRHL